MHDHSGGSEKLRLVLLSDVLLVCVKKFRAEKLTITDYLWLADAAPVRVDFKQMLQWIILKHLFS